jgi:hypothetical protein
MNTTKVAPLFSAKPGRTGLCVKVYEPQPLRKGLRTKLGTYIPSLDYKQHLKQLIEAAAITNRARIKSRKRLRDLYCQEIAQPKLLLTLLQWCKEEWSGIIVRRRQEHSWFYRQLNQALNVRKASLTKRLGGTNARAAVAA